MLTPNIHPSSEPPASLLDIMLLLCFIVLVSLLCFIMLYTLLNGSPAGETMPEMSLETAATIEANSMTTPGFLESGKTPRPVLLHTSGG